MEPRTGGNGHRARGWITTLAAALAAVSSAAMLAALGPSPTAAAPAHAASAPAPPTAPAAPVTPAPTGSVTVQLPPVTPKEFWVAPWGTCSQWQLNLPGNPFPTFQVAQAQVRLWLATNPTQPTVIHVAGAEYYIDEPLVFTAADSGTSSYPVTWQAWNGGTTHNDDDVLVNGGVRLNNSSTWTNVGTTPDGGKKWRCTLDSYNLPHVPRDAWYNGYRQIRARFPNIPESGGTGSWTSSTLPPYANEGFMVVQRVDRDQLAGDDVQLVTIRNGVDPASTSNPPARRDYEFPDTITSGEWAGIEIVGHHAWASPRQIVTMDGMRIEDGPPSNEVRVELRFPVLQWTNTMSWSPAPNHVQELGCFGVFDFEDPVTQSSGYARRFLQVSGEDFPTPNQNEFYWPTQVYLENHFDFLDAKREWYCDDEYFWIVTPCEESPALQSPGVILPVANQLLILEGASYITFKGLDFAYSNMPFPEMGEMRDPPSPPEGYLGYATVQSGWQWIDEVQPWHLYNALPGAVELRGAEFCKFQECRIGHVGGSGVTMGTRFVDASPDQYHESNYNQVEHCEIFDVGGHGVYIGDNRTQQPNGWQASPNANYPDPHKGNTVTESYIHHYGVIYKDGAGVFFAHTDGTVIADCYIWLGNWTGIAVGGLLRHKYSGVTPIPTAPESDCCGFTGTGSIYWPQTNQNAIVQRNHVKSACLRLNDGAGIYSMGANDNSLLDANYVEEINHSPYKNFIHVVAGIYFDGGSEGWTVTNNYVRDAQYPFWFGAGKGATTIPNTCAWGAASWPVAWMPTCGPVTDNFLGWPGLTWSTSAPNWWREPANGNAGYKSVVACKGYPGMTDTTASPPMYFPLYNGSNSGQNFTIDNDGAGGSGAIASAAGPANFSTWFPGTGERIFETDPCESGYSGALWPW